jgi:hypothetical protein
MDEQYLVIGTIAGAVILIGGILAFFILKERKRTEVLGFTAEEMGLAFSPKVDRTFLSTMPEFHLFSRGRSKRVSNLMEGTFGGTRALVFDYKYTTGGGKNSHTYRQTVICFELQNTLLPSFSLRPENVLHKLGSRLGYQDIDFEDYPEFSARYLLRGSDEEAIRNVFTDSILSFYEMASRLCTEGNGSRMLFYRQSKRVRPEELQMLLEEGLEALSLFDSPASGGTGSRSW